MWAWLRRTICGRGLGPYGARERVEARQHSPWPRSQTSDANAARVAELRATLAVLEAAEVEMARVVYECGMTFVGYPVLATETVSLYGIHDNLIATVAIEDLSAVGRVFAANPPKARPA